MRWGANSVRFGGTVCDLVEQCEVWCKKCEVWLNSVRFGGSSESFGGAV